MTNNPQILKDHQNSPKKPILQMSLEFENNPKL